MAVTLRYNGQVYEGTEAEFNDDPYIWDHNDLLFSTDTNTLKKGNDEDVYPDLPFIGGGGGGNNGGVSSVTGGNHITITGTPENPVINTPNIERGTIPGSINRDSELSMTLGSLGFIDNFAGDANTIDIGGTGLGVYYVPDNATNLPTPAGLLIHGQRLAGDGHGEFQFFTSADPTDPVWDGLFVRWRVGQNSYSPWDKVATKNQVEAEIKTINLDANESLIVNDSAPNSIFALNSNGLGLEVPLFAAPHATADRPTLNATDAGAQIFDTTLGQPIWWDGTNWIDGAGTTV